MSPKQGLVVVGAVLAATTRVQQHLLLWLTVCHSHLQHRVYQGLMHPVVHRPADDSARIEIEHNGQIQPALGSPHVGHVRDPVLVGAIRGELAIQVIWCNRQIMATARN